MARFQCHHCSFDGNADWTGECICPSCGSAIGVRAAFRIEELTGRDADAFERLAAELECAQTIDDHFPKAP